jgi:hypothetical protein
MADLLATSRIPTEGVSGAIVTIDQAHREIHEGDAFTAYYTLTTAASNGVRTGLFFKTPNTTKRIHVVPAFSASAAANFSILEAPTIAANVGTHAVVIYNRDRNSANTSVVSDNATSPAANKVTTLTEAQIAGDGTWALGTVLRTAPLTVGAGPFASSTGNDRGSQEFIAKANTKYVFLITNTAASANNHFIVVDWYEV